MTTFVTRKTVRDATTALLIANGTWQTGYAYEPRDMDGLSPVFTLRSGGTQTGNETGLVSPTNFRLILTNYVLVADPENTASWDADDAEDKLDELDREVREIVRDNTPAGCDYIEMEDSPSSTGYVEIDGEIYRTEEFVLVATLEVGT